MKRSILHRLFVCGQKSLVLLLIFYLSFVDLSYITPISLPAIPSVPEAKAAAGDFSVFRTATNTDSVANGGTEREIVWDQVVSEATGIELQSGSTTIDLSEGGKYLVLYNAWTEETLAGGQNRRSFETYLTLNESELVYGRGAGYIRDSNGDDEFAYTNGAAIIDASAGDDLEVNIARDDANTDNNTRLRAGTNGVSVIKMRDDFNYARIPKTTRSADISGNTAFTDVTWDDADELDTDSYTYSSGSGDITLKGSLGDYFLVTYNVRLHQDANNGERQNYESRLTLGGAEVPGTRVTTYVRGNASSNGTYFGTLAYSGLVRKTSASDQILNVEVRRESVADATPPSTDIVESETGITIAALPSSAHYISLTSTSTQTVANTQSPVDFDRQIEVEGSAFSHSTTSNASRINIDLDGDYLFFSNMYATRINTSGDRDPYRVDWRLDGNNTVAYGGHGSFLRGNQGTQDSYAAGSAGGLVLPGLTDTQYLEVTMFDEEDAASGAVLATSSIAIQGVEMKILFQTDVDVSATSSQIATTSVPVADVNMGGLFIIEENTGTRNVTSITLTESGTIDAQNGLDNIELYYDLDTTAPYNCVGESYGGGESKYGDTDDNGFTGTDGVSSFSDVVSISTTQSMCVYVIYDVTNDANDGDTIEISIDDPSTDVLVTNSGVVGPSTVTSPTGSTTVEDAELTQTHYRWLSDDGLEGSATALAAEDTPVSGFANGTIRRVRFQVDAAGSVDSLGTIFTLEYATKTAACSASTTWIDVGAPGGVWDMSDSLFIVDGANASNIATTSGGVSDPAGPPTFLTVNSGLRDTSSQTGSLTVGFDEFVEFEFAIEPTATAPDGNTYCFRLSNDGTALRNYSVYAEGTISADITVSATGTATSSIDVGATNEHTGGGFVVEREGTGSRTVTGITVSATGTIDLQNDISNIELYYDIDSTAPIDCTGESYGGGETQFGSGILGGFTSTSSATFSGSETVSDTQSMCVYVVLDVGSNAVNGETLDISIADPSTDVVVTTSTVGPSSLISPTGSTTIAGPEITQTGYHWRNDDDNEADASSATAGTENSPLLEAPQDVTYRLRMQLSNEGTVDSAASQYQLEYGTKVTSCSEIGTWQSVDSGVAFTMGTTSQLVDGNDTTDVTTGAISNPGGKTFLSPNGGQKEDDDTTGNITLTSTQFVELEYALQVTDQSAYDTSYCFRLTDSGTELPVYTEYAELTTRERQDFFIQRGTSFVSGNGDTMTAGVDYVAPASSSLAFVRITNTHFTGAGRNTQGTQSADDVTAYISDQSDLTNNFVITRPAGAANNTRVSWEIVEYTGLTGADNEIIVRDTGTVTYVAGNTAATGTAVTSIADDDDVVVFITGQLNPSTLTTAYLSGLSTSDWHSTSSVPVFTRGQTGTAVGVSYAVVEFTGLNWRAQRTEHTYVTDTGIETESISPVNSLDRSFIHAQKRIAGAANGLDDAGHQVSQTSIGTVNFLLNSGADTPSDHTSVAWVIENTQTGDGAMEVFRDSDTVDANEAVEPRLSLFSFNGPSNTMSNTSIFGTNDSTGGGTAFPRAMLGLTVTSTSQYEIFESDAGQTQDFEIMAVQWPVAQLAFQQNYYQFYVNNDTATPTDPWPAGASDLGENFVLTGADDPIGEAEQIRIRMSVLVNNATFPADTTSFKLQFGLRDTTCSAISSWTDVGGLGSAVIWRGYDATPADGLELDSTILSVSDVAATYEETNNSAVNPNSAEPGEDVEYDWVIEHNGAVQRSDYCFRLVESDGTELSAYNNYPTLRTTGYTPIIDDWRWYGDETSVTPGSDLAAENVAPTGIVNDDAIKLRLIAAEVENAVGENVKFRLQHSEYPDFSDGGTFVAEIADCTATTTWCYYDGAGVDNATITTAVLADTDICIAGFGAGCGTHNEFATTSSTHIQPASSKMEFEFTIEPGHVRTGSVHYFRLYDVATEDAISASSTYPSVVAETAQLTFTSSGVASSTVTEGITTDADTSTSSVSFGLVPFAAEHEVAHRLTIDTNALEGYQIFMVADQTMQNPYGTEISSIASTNASPAAWSTGCSALASCFGYHAGDDTLAAGSARFAPDDTYAAVSTTTLEEVAYSPIPANESHDIVYKIEIPNDQEAGLYTTNITYIAVPVY